MPIRRINEILSEQDRTIRELRRENNDLRRQLLLPLGTTYDTTTHRRGRGDKHLKSRVMPTFDSSNHVRNLGARYDRRQPPTRYHGELRPTMSSQPMFQSTQRLTPHCHEDKNGFETGTSIGPEYQGFTSGTKFVAEVNKYMNIDQGHKAPLSVIVDKHWDKLKYHMREDANGY